MDSSQIIITSVVSSLLIMGATLSAIFYAQKRARDRRILTWRGLAARFGGSVEVGPGLLKQGLDRLIVPIDGFTVSLDVYIVQHGKNSTAYQRAATLTPVSWSRCAEIYKETPLFSAIGKAFGGQDVQIGDADFDSAFIIKCNDQEWLKRGLSRSTRVAHVAAPEHRLVITAHSLPALKNTRPAEPDDLAEELRRRVPAADGVLSLTRVGATADEARILTQLRLVAAYARDLLTSPESQ